MQKKRKLDTQEGKEDAFALMFDAWSDAFIRGCVQGKSFPLALALAKRALRKSLPKEDRVGREELVEVILLAIENSEAVLRSNGLRVNPFGFCDMVYIHSFRSVGIKPVEVSRTSVPCALAFQQKRLDF
jgi:hypothetical protein